MNWYKMNNNEIAKQEQSLPVKLDLDHYICKHWTIRMFSVNCHSALTPVLYWQDKWPPWDIIHLVRFWIMTQTMTSPVQWRMTLLVNIESSMKWVYFSKFAICCLYYEGQQPNQMEMLTSKQSKLAKRDLRKPVISIICLSYRNAY